MSPALADRFFTSELLATAAAKLLQSCPTLRPHRRQPTRLLRPWDSPGKNTEVGCHFLLQCMKVKSESEVAHSCPTLHNPIDFSLPGSSIHGSFQARVLEWVAVAFSAELLGSPIFYFLINFFSLSPKTQLLTHWLPLLRYLCVFLIFSSCFFGGEKRGCLPLILENLRLSSWIVSFYIYKYSLGDLDSWFKILPIF